MPGNRLSLVRCWGPAAFHFPGWIGCESFGGGEVCTLFKFCLYGKICMIFKPDTEIINHQIEFSRTRVKYLDHEKKGLLAYPQKPLIIAHSCVSRETRCLKVVWSLLQLAYFMHARSDSPGEVMRTCRLFGAFATCRCTNQHHLVCWPNYSINFSLRTIILFSYSVL